MDATVTFTPKADFSAFKLARLPGSFYFFDKLDTNGQPIFGTVKSNFISHTELLVR